MKIVARIKLLLLSPESYFLRVTFSKQLFQIMQASRCLVRPIDEEKNKKKTVKYNLH